MIFYITEGIHLFIYLGGEGPNLTKPNPGPGWYLGPAGRRDEQRPGRHDDPVGHGQAGLPAPLPQYPRGHGPGRQGQPGRQPAHSTRRTQGLQEGGRRAAGQERDGGLPREGEGLQADDEMRPGPGLSADQVGRWSGGEQTQGRQSIQLLVWGVGGVICPQ